MKRAYLKSTGVDIDQHLLRTGTKLVDFADPVNQPILADFGFVLKFKKDCSCPGDTCSPD